MIRRPPRSTLSSSSAASDVYKRQLLLFQGSDGSQHGVSRDAFEGDELAFGLADRAGQPPGPQVLPDDQQSRGPGLQAGGRLVEVVIAEQVQLVAGEALEGVGGLGVLDLDDGG